MIRNFISMFAPDDIPIVVSIGYIHIRGDTEKIDFDLKYPYEMHTLYIIDWE